MPHGSSPGERRGGRKAGTLNHATREALDAERIHQQVAMRPEEAAERAPEVEQEIEQAVRAPMRKLAKERLEDLLEIAIGCTAFYQPPLTEKQAKKEPNANQNWAEFKDWLKIAVDIGHKLAHFQSPTYRAIVVTTPGEMSGPAPSPAPAELFDEGEDAATRAQQAYLRLVKG